MNAEEIMKMVKTPMFRKMMGADEDTDVEKMFKDDPNLIN